ncbi:MAG: LysM peptidoglycan-binding domain-containing protein [Bacteroidales bacterium]|nr:LysM peptidoglycan-binding domain-containing protein [Bacteroidales bacterium]
MEKAYQNIDRNKIKVEVVNGQTGKVEPAKTSSDSNSSSSDVTYHRVKKGETLSSIARKYHTTVAKLCKLNHIKETSILQIGQKLKVK